MLGKMKDLYFIKKYSYYLKLNIKTIFFDKNILIRKLICTIVQKQMDLTKNKFDRLNRSTSVLQQIFDLAIVLDSTAVYHQHVYLLPPPTI